PRFWNRRGRDPSTLPIEPNGFLLTMAGLDAASELKVSTSHGDFSLPVGKLELGQTRRALNGRVECERLPTSRLIFQAATEDGYPCALSGPDGRTHVAFLAFQHGVGFETRLPIATRLDDFSFLAKPTGGDQVMFLELQGERWTAPVPLSEAGGDLFGLAMAFDGKGRLWVFWSANVRENWDLYGVMRNGDQWSGPVRITSAPGSDFNHVAATDGEGRIWLAWQHLNETDSDICVASQQGDTFGEPIALASSPANEWAPAIAASSDGRMAVAWDSYEQGNYDVLVRVRQSERWGEARPVAATRKNECRASVVFDPRNRLWIAYEVSPEGWGKDYGPYDQTPKNTALYQERSIGVKMLKDDLLYTPESDVNRALPMPNGNRRYPKAGDSVRAAGPKLAVDANGRLWLATRIRIDRFDNVIGGAWLSFVTTLDADGWKPATLTPQSDGFLHESSSLVPVPGGGLYVVSCSDSRFVQAATFGPAARRKGPRGQDLPPATTRTRTVYPDQVFNRELAIADTGPVARPDGDPKLVEVPADAPGERSPAASREAEQVAAMRAYRAELGGKSLRIVRGEFHRHTEISSDGGGDGSLFDMWRYALDMASQDWIGNGDHDNGNGREFSWWMIQKTTSLFTIPRRFTPMFTYERSVNYPDGHRNAVFAERGVRPLARLQGGTGRAMDNLPAEADRPNSPDTLMFYDYLKYFNGVCASHTSGTDMGTDWRDNDPKVEPMVEIYQGDRQNYERPGAPRSNSAEYSIGGWRPLGFVSNALLKGYRLGFQSSSDHISTHMSYCNVWVEEPTREAILEAMKLRRVYGATDNIIADVRCGEHFMGEEFATDRAPTLQVKLIGTAPFDEVVIVKDNEYVYSVAPNERTVEFRWTDMDATPGKTSYYYVRGRQVGQTKTRKVSGPGGERTSVDLNDGELVWASPMWITFRPAGR
ncbi:MAG: hypothetical protein JJ992_01670, partial [Planctomycetes bacterium]|nr:hypothetical protein [Planctomycetota bacterium]